MSKPKKASPACIRLRGVRQNNLKNFDLDLPLGRLVVITGLSGSGKSSLAFDTLYAEGQRRYIETFSPYVRQFFDRMDKPAVDRIENIPPAIAIEQRNAVRTTRSTVGTMTEVCEHMKALWNRLAQLHCRQCGKPVRPEPPQAVWAAIQGDLHPADSPRTLELAAVPPEPDRLRDVAPAYLTAEPPPSPKAHEVLITFDLPLSDRLPWSEQLDLLQKQGFQRVLANDVVLRIEDLLPSPTRPNTASAQPQSLTVVVDRIRPLPTHRARFNEAFETAYKLGRGRNGIRPNHGSGVRAFSAAHHCAACDIDYREPTTALFSFNNPVGACSTCKGFGRVIGIDPDLALPDRSLTLAQGVVRPWQTATGLQCQADLTRAARRRKVPMDIPFRDLSAPHQLWVMEGEDGYDSSDPERSWPKLWYGVKGYFKWLESKAYKMHVRVLLSRYRSYRTCPDCKGRRFNSDSLLHRLEVPPQPGQPAATLTLADFYSLPVSEALAQLEALASHHRPARHDPLSLLFDELRARLGYLVEVGLGYLTLDRPTRTLSGGETERVNLTTCLGSRLVNTLYVLDEPSVGLHPRDTQRLIGILQRLRDLGNTVVVVEHESAVMRAADHLVDLGPGHGETGGHIVFQGAPDALAKARGSITADYLTGRRNITGPLRRPVLLNDTPESTPTLRLRHATLHNLQDLAVDIPLSRLVCISGVSGSGKTTLVREILLPLLQARLRSPGSSPTETTDPVGTDPDTDSRPSQPSADLDGTQHLGSVMLVDQSSLGRTPRSNPAVYIGAFDHIRDVFAQAPMALERGMNSSAFSFNSSNGQCERCRGAGFEKIEMQFLSDVFIRCPVCHGRRYRQHVLEVTVKPVGQPAWSIGDLLDAPVEKAVEFLAALPDSRAARCATTRLRLLVEVGLGYLRAGQPINTLSGGESQRLKLVSHLAEWSAIRPGKGPGRPTLFLFDEPTTGLHFEDIRILLTVFQRMVDQGHSVVVVEHNLDVIRQADWIIDLGPDAGAAGGKVVVVGTPEQVAAHPSSQTGRFLALEN